MATQGWNLRMHSYYLSKRCPRKFLAVTDAYARLQQIKDILSEKGADLMTPCGMNNSHKCDLFKQLNGWNEVLAAVKVEIEELVSVGELAVYLEERRFDQRETKARIERAVILLNWFFLRHTCVARVEFNKLGYFADPEWFVLFCDGIHQCRRLQVLWVIADISEAFRYRQMLKACGPLQHLKELRFGTICDTKDAINMGIMAALILRNKTLEVFHLGSSIATSKGRSAVMEALRRSGSLSDLSLNVIAFEAEESSCLLKILNRNEVLKILRLDSDVSQRYITVNTVTAALSNATALAQLELSGFRMHMSDAWTLALRLVRAQTVRSLVLIDCPSCFLLPNGHRYSECTSSWGHISNRIQPYLYMIEKVHSLRKLEIDLLSFDSRDQREFLEELAANSHLKELSVESPLRGYPHEFCSLAIETGTASRIHMEPLVIEESDFADLQKVRRAESLTLKAQADTPNSQNPNVNVCLAELGTCDYVAHLTLEITGGVIHPRSAELLAHYLQHTTSLQTAVLNFTVTKELSMLLLDAISRNNSITTLGVEKWCLGKRTAAVLADIICSSKKIAFVIYNQKSKVPRKDFFSRLSKSIASNYTLVSVETFEHPKNTRKSAMIQNVLSRNSTFLERAARFVAELSAEKIDAEALEIVASSPLLPTRVQHLLDVDEQSASTMVTLSVRSLRYLDAFMSITGVVRESVVCEDNNDGRPRLDTLPEYCWLAIRQYLAISDVINV